MGDELKIRWPQVQEASSINEMCDVKCKNMFTANYLSVYIIIV